MDFFTDKFGIWAGGRLGAVKPAGLVPVTSAINSEFSLLARSAKNTTDALSNSNDALSIDTTASSRRSANDPSLTSAGASRLLGDTQSIISIAQSALSAITDLQNQKLTAATSAANSALGENTANQQSQISTLDTEIKRIQASANFNGKNVFTDITSFTAGQSSDPTSTSNTLILNVPNLGSVRFTSATNTSVTSQATAAASVTSLTSDLASTESLTNAFSSAQGEVTKAIENEQKSRAAAASDSSVVTEATATDLAKSIASQLVNPYSTEIAKQALIDLSAGNLNADSVQALTNDSFAAKKVDITSILSPA